MIADAYLFFTLFFEFVYLVDNDSATTIQVVYLREILFGRFDLFVIIADVGSFYRTARSRYDDERQQKNQFVHCSSYFGPATAQGPLTPVGAYRSEPIRLQT